jgi:hypothetical protein
MARPAQTCTECRALVPVDQVTNHMAWHTALTAALGRTTANHPHGPVTATAERSGKQ